jgi:hypothetical protein
MLQSDAILTVKKNDNCCNCVVFLVMFYLSCSCWIMAFYSCTISCWCDWCSHLSQYRCSSRHKSIISFGVDGGPSKHNWQQVEYRTCQEWMHGVCTHIDRCPENSACVTMGWRSTQSQCIEAITIMEHKLWYCYFMQLLDQACSIVL